MTPVDRRQCQGLSLIEMLVATTIFAILGTLCYRAVDIAASSEQHIEQALQRWQALGRGVQRLQNSLQSITTNPVTTGDAATAPSLLLRDGPGGAPDIEFLRIDKRGSLRRQGIRLVDGQLLLLSWAGRQARGEPVREILLDRVRQIRWSFVKQGIQLPGWPLSDADSQELPDAIALELELADLGTVSRLILLRW